MKRTDLLPQDCAFMHVCTCVQLIPVLLQYLEISFCLLAFTAYACRAAWTSVCVFVCVYVIVGSLSAVCVCLSEASAKARARWSVYEDLVWRHGLNSSASSFYSAFCSVAPIKRRPSRGPDRCVSLTLEAPEGDKRRQETAKWPCNCPDWPLNLAIDKHASYVDRDLQQWLEFT